MINVKETLQTLKFFGQGLGHFFETGTVFPSPPRVINAICDAVDWHSAKSIAELGAGDGRVTAEILQRMRYDSRLTVYETNPKFILDLEGLNDGRLTVVNKPAGGLDFPVDVVISTLPRGVFEITDRKSPTLDTVVANLSSDCQFVHHQYWIGPEWLGVNPVAKALRGYFDNVSHRFVRCYAWPASVYKCSGPNSRR